MTGLPGDYSSPSGFLRAFLATQTSVPLENLDATIDQACRILGNFDYPKGFVRIGKGPDNYMHNFTTWTVIGDSKNKRYYWWTEWNRHMRVVEFGNLRLDSAWAVAVPPDKDRSPSIDDRSKVFLG